MMILNLLKMIQNLLKMMSDDDPEILISISFNDSDLDTLFSKLSVLNRTEISIDDDDLEVFSDSDLEISVKDDDNLGI
ncbi:hypothetical protein NPIL_599371 [Nephila pilipes]|uniref:Uncharacterized protein n=1 Tax=Nephila pilipes TaxID=299642 RepID=A0A8X6QSR7_NEPPI|nr:hypothetical protein NPIL_599371 [Nephila pilipes]